MLYEVLGDIWVVRRNPYLQDDLLDNPKRRKQLIDALNHRVGEIDRRREPGTPAEAGHDPQRDEKVVSLLARARSAIAAFEGEFDQTAMLRKQRRRRWAASPRATTSSSMACRASRT